RTKVLQSTATGRACCPVWMPDGRRLLYNPGNLLLGQADGSGQPTVISEEKLRPLSLSSYGQFGLVVRAPDDLFGQRQSRGGPNPVPAAAPPARGLSVLPLTGEVRKSRLLVESQTPVTYAVFSPDRRLIAYSHNDSDRSDIYITRFPDVTETLKVSRD